MRSRGALSVMLLVTATSCGDGVGNPIVSGQAGRAAATAPAESGFGGGGAAAGAGAVVSAAGMTGAGVGGLAGVGGAGTSGMSTTGAVAGADGVGRQRPWGNETGGWGMDPGMDDTVPPGSHCEPAADWPRESASAEQQLFQLLNSTRQSGFACGSSAGVAAPPLTFSPELRCAARLHSRDMSERAFFSHVNPDGVGPEDRMRRAGYSFAVAGESIARDDLPEPSGLYDALAELFAAGGSDCNNLMDPRFDAVGIGVFQGLWTLDFAGP